MNHGNYMSMNSLLCFLSVKDLLRVDMINQCWEMDGNLIKISP